MTPDRLINHSVFADTNIEALKMEIQQTREDMKFCDRRSVTEAGESLIKKLKNQIFRTERNRRIVNEYIETLDPEIRQIIYYHFFKHKSWTQTNIKIYGYPCYEYSRKRYERYFEKRTDQINELERKTKE